MGKRILVLGAGRSSLYLIDYLLKHAYQNKWYIVVGDYNKDLAFQRISNHELASAIFFDANDSSQRFSEIRESDIVVSMLPPSIHYLIAQDCVVLGKDLVTASYVSPQLQELDKDAKAKNILLLNELGLDPGIDHMSAMEMINKIKDQKGEIILFKSFCGGLIHPDYDDNIWNYKFTWNPRNVVLAGQGDSQFLDNNI
ncbi:MAG: saccharopine dehydrogenase C-terminal domain-containing protein, partial [Bacteroidota bacterium]|nr:saccharopine dehydrogenase C-terminal domain-containing protein [Bacteroidota bacterium]